MNEFVPPIHLTSPQEKSKRVKDAQWTLNGHNFFGVDFKSGAVDGSWGLMSGQAADQARFVLGYPMSQCDTRVFGQELFDYLRVDGNRKKLPLTYLARRKARLRAKHSTKAKALAYAITQIGTEESPPFSNVVKYSTWYGYHSFWCAMFVTYCFVVGGQDKKVFLRGQRTAWAYWPEWMARADMYGLRITRDPEPGDIVVYHYHQGHIGIFEMWIDRKKGLFSTIEGNTSESSADNGGAVMRRTRSLTWTRTVFVSYPN